MSVDYTFEARRKTQIYAELVVKEGSMEAAKWLSKNTSLEELKLIEKYITKELKKHEFITE
tara:strand:- start:644 stop:826 length:183 start_codon:yes stop_codon:yes gene_type:complete